MDSLESAPKTVLDSSGLIGGLKKALALRMLRRKQLVDLFRGGLHHLVFIVPHL